MDLSDPKHPPYEAISYTWGPEPTSTSPALPITINGQEVLIRQNLHECLLRMRKPDEVRVLWNDFLCIDQDRLDEKGRQVAMIGDVFHDAERVRVWVGEHDGGSEMLFRGWPEERKIEERGALGLVLGFDRKVLRRSKLSREESKMRSDVWMQFFNRRYWGRTWIVQEVYQAKEIVVHCGEDEMDWDELIGNRFDGESFFDGISLRAMLNVPESDQLGSNVIGRIRELNANRRGSSGTPEGGFDDKGILFFTQHFQHSWCSVPHDKVYGFLSMEGPGYRNRPIAIDYNMSLPELLVSIYEKRNIQHDEQLQLSEWKKTLPEAHAVLASLRLNQKQRMEVLKIVASRATHAQDEIERQRWQNLYTQLEFAIDKLWRRDKSVSGTSDKNYGPDLKWDESEEHGSINDDANQMVASSAKIGYAGVKFGEGEYYIKLPTPFSRKRKE